ncbi:MAG: pilus assembly protein [Silicimonas sp.]|nr:pilus assembly protein [Silicimonas sp.]NNL74517.1 pilus assembly protein [Silicimonas sp.]RZW06517.1 MAG: pilus assembly protein [Paracoccaceae bacterium]
MKLTFGKCFRRTEDGSLSIETVLALPMLVWAITATFVFWDAFKTLNVSQKATYTVADMLSRETQEIDGNYLTAMHELFDYLASTPGDNALRVTVVRMVEDPNTNVKTRELVWSQGVGGIAGYTDLTVLDPRLPDMSDGDQLIVVESEQEWTPAFTVGLASYRFREVAISRPRFAPKLVWDTTSSTPTGGSV